MFTATATLELLKNMESRNQPEWDRRHESLCELTLHGWVLKLKKNNESYASLVREIKNIIDQGLDVANGFIVEFNSDYSKIRKYDAAATA